MATTAILQRVSLPQQPVSPIDPLLCALAKLHIIPFTPESVACYQERTVFAAAENTRPQMLQYYRRYHAFAPLLAKLIKPTFDGCNFTNSRAAYAIWTNWLGSPNRKDGKIMKRFSWNLVPLEVIGCSALPMEASAMVTAISREVPEAQFFMDVLRDEKEEAFDPFLVVRFFDPSLRMRRPAACQYTEEYYLYVWDETYRP